MTDSAVLNTVLGLVFLFYPLARYDAMLHAPVPTSPREPAKTAPGEVETALPAEWPIHRDTITLSDVMAHPLVQPSRHATSLGKPTRNPSYLPSSVFARTVVDLLTPGSVEPALADIEAGVGALQNSPQLQQSLSSILKVRRVRLRHSSAAFRRGLTVKWIVSQARTSDGPNDG